MARLADAKATDGAQAHWPRGVIAVGLQERPSDLVRAVLAREAGDVELTEAADAGEAAGRRADLVVVFTADAADDVRPVAGDTDTVVVLTEPVTTTAVRRLLDQGVKGVVPGDDWPATLGAVCRAVRAGQICVPAAHGGALEPPMLSLRERQVLALITQGLSNADIAKRLFLAESTVKSHAAAAFRRLGVNSRREAVARVLGPDDDLRRIVLTSHRPEFSAEPQGRFRRDPRS